MPSRNITGIRELGRYAIRLGCEGSRHVPRRQTRHEPDTRVWERLNNADFNPLEFDGIRMKAGVNSFTRYFYKPQPLRTLEEIRADIKALERDTEGLLDEILTRGKSG